ncbi:GMC oxidoreductase-domain-containing protein [Lentinula edodes]|uniref:GMC oxidoreductase-domain-containing protein n=1 Tax=Lentinula edodes TaxID=5353 RepID=UPI001E8D7E48|nr:GMC oxidoreductase-domain-containing protein [Lentinula edodes]KAH7868464.1 GMC oxidoreductase-domain-containing protein [Lentinula edodes]
MPLFDTYDIVFAGGGTAACIIAGRLVQADSSLKILVIEAGPHSFNLHNHVQPARYLNSLVQGHTVTLHNSVHSEALGGRSVSVPSGCCVGGGSAVNFMIYTRAAASDYDDWEKLGNSGWGSNSLIPLARKVETYQVPSDSPSAHGSTGPIKVSHGGHDTNIGKEFLTAAQYDKDRKSSPSADINDFQTTNVYGPWHKYIDSDTGKRSDVAHHFLYNLPNFSLDPNEGNNLHVLTNRRVVKVIFKDNRAIGVEYVAREDLNVESRLPPRIAYASRLVVLSSGAFGSPAILERSGIGSARYLADADIRQIVDLPGVGENYNDHTLCVTPYLASEDSDCLDDIFNGDEEAIKPHLKEWQEEGSGLLAHNSVDAGVKLRPTQEELEELGPSFRQIWEEFYVGAPDKPVACLVPTAGDVQNSAPSGLKTFGIIFFMAYPRATGYTHISSPTNPWAPLRFDPKFLEDPADLSVLRWCYKHARELARRMKSFRGEIPARHPKFCSNSSVSGVNNGTPCTMSCNGTSYVVPTKSTASIIPSASGPFAIDSPKIVYSKEDDRAIDDYIRAIVGTTWHSLGTCAMKPREAGGVVDSRLNVYGVENLKIADMSIAPLNVGANTNNTALVIGEKAFLLIAEDLGISLESETISQSLKNLSLCAHLNGN